METQLNKLKELFKQWSGNQPDKLMAIPPSGSDRRYFRLAFQNTSAIGAWNPVKEENVAFLYFSKYFHAHGLNVPAIYGEDAVSDVYLMEDLGNVSLFSLLEKLPADSAFPDQLRHLYQASLKELIRFQLVAGKNLDYKHCYPHSAFDAQSMKWDLQYFKYYFLKLHIPFHESKLEDDFDSLVRFLGQAGPDHFMYRDFQSRNILIKDNKPYFIDYQGGRKGPLQYDVASLLFQVKADLPFDLREELLDYYLTVLSSYFKFDKEDFIKHYYGFVLIRLLQVLGAYGFRGLIEKKPHFLSSIPYAMKNLSWWLHHVDLPINLPELLPALEKLAGLAQYRLAGTPSHPGILTIIINSFSYKKGIPEDASGHGGGFVFDCRALPNPGREERYRSFNGKDQVIIDYLKDDPAVLGFLEDTEKLLSRSIEKYLERGFDRLTANFGCTGGQHRSVYCAETMADILRKKYPQVRLEVTHVMLNA